MSTIQARIDDIETEIRKTKKNKATETHLGLLKAKLAKLKRELIDNATKSSGGGGEGFEVSKTGDARIGLVGKLTINNRLPFSGKKYTDDQVNRNLQ
jgi:ribosome-interacting GTPase 1